MHLTSCDRLALVDAAASHQPDALEHALAAIQARNPHAFHTKDSLCLRVFFDQPVRGEPCRGFQRFATRPKRAA